MQKRQLNQTTMCNTLLALLEPKTELLTGMPALFEVRERLKEMLARLENLAMQQASVSKGKTDVKQELQEKMIAQAFKLCNAIRAYGAKAGATELLARIPSNETSIKRQRDLDQITTCRTILRDAEALNGQLTSYKCGPEVLQGFGEVITSYETAISERDSSVAHRGSATMSIEEHFSAIDKLLEYEMDPIIEVLRDEDPALHKAWFAARYVRSTGVRHNGSSTPDTGTPETPSAPLT